MVIIGLLVSYCMVFAQRPHLIHYTTDDGLPSYYLTDENANIMIKSILVEDEPKAMYVLKECITRYCPELNIVGMAKDAKEAYNLIVQHRPQLLFLDIEISNTKSPENSFDLLRRLPQYPYELIFVTAFRHYSIKAIKFHALDYLLKPINIDELEIAVQKAIKRLKGNAPNRQLNDFVEHLQNPQERKKRLWISMSGGYQVVELSEIVYLEASGKYTFLYMANQKKILSSQNLKFYIDLLKDYSEFMQVHRSYVINIHYIDQYLTKDGGLALMKTAAEIPIARRKKQEFLDRMMGSSLR